MARKRRSSGGGGGGGGHDAGGGLRWLLTYADVVTLLLALFIYFYSVSIISEEKVTAFSRSLARTFGIFEGNRLALEGGTGMLPNAASLRLPDSIPDTAVEPHIDELKAAGFILGRDENELRLRISADLLFPPGSSDLSAGATSRLSNLALFFNQIVPQSKVRIEGHTDNADVGGGRFGGGNWELSAVRAAVVASALVTNYGVKPGQISVAGFGPYHPIEGSVENQTEDARAANRRVEVVILLNAAERRSRR